MCCEGNVYRRALIPRKLPCPEKFLVTRLLSKKFVYVLMLKYINLGSQLQYKKYNQKLHHVEYDDEK